MSACPRCEAELRPLRERVGGGEECRACGMVWLDGGLLTNVVGAAALQRVVKAAARGKRRCRGCGEPLGYTPNCPACGELPLGCPACGRDLRTVALHGVDVEVCNACEGVLLDPDELARLREASPGEPHPARTASPALTTRGPLSCTGCGKALGPEHAFGFAEEGATWCGSCAPAGSHQLLGELSRRRATDLLGRTSSMPYRYGGSDKGLDLLEGLIARLFG
ncbi:MAG: zf-TFIIB domain-containing protein [Deltaproteobacteria bacterium]|nr:zf-TFIIB domain-containing protein [Deltaproteobacteria bacterium]